MELMPSFLVKNTPPLYGTEHLPLADKIVQVKWFTPWSSWYWYVVEYDPAQRIAWGLVVGHENEWGYVSVDELEQLKGPGGLKVEWDFHFEPSIVRDLIRKERIDMDL